MELLLSAQHQVLKDRFSDPQNFRISEGGHMAYRRVLFDDAFGEAFFVKAHNPSLLSEQWRRDEMIYFLDKEARVYNHLENHDFTHIPKLELYDENMLVLRGLTSQKGWHWRTPNNQLQQEQYILDVLASFKALESVPPMKTNHQDEVSLDTFYNYGWDKLHDINTSNLVSNNLVRWRNSLHPETPRSALQLAKFAQTLAVKRINIQKNVFNHHDARQSNIAWHPEYGVKIVDWSWADAGLKNGDATMFLLDLHKSNHDIKDSVNTINPVYAKMMLGYWLQRSQTEHMEGNDNVRMQQFISAIKASELLIGLLSN
jgi:hypothetical protein